MKLYETPEMEIKTFSVEDVVTTSGEFDPGEGGTTPVNPFG